MYPLHPPVAVFPLGRIAATASALVALTKFEIAAGLARHVKGDWGDLRKKQRKANDRALDNGSRISSSYITKSGRRFLIVTEADRSETTVLLPEEPEPAKRPTSRDSLQCMEPSSFERESFTPEAAYSSRRTAEEGKMEQLELFMSNPSNRPLRQRLKSEPQEWKVISLRECPSPESLMLMDRPAKAVEYWNRHIATAPHYNADVECVAVLVLTTRLRIRGHYLVSVGSLNEAMAHPREVFRIAIMAAAHAIVLMHNHPSGDSSPSTADASLTRRVREAGELLRIDLCDHIIVGHQRYFSFKESGIV